MTMENITYFIPGFATVTAYFRRRSWHLKMGLGVKCSVCIHKYNAAAAA